MRELTLPEVKTVSGGGRQDTIVVTAQRIPSTHELMRMKDGFGWNGSNFDALKYAGFGGGDATDSNENEEEHCPNSTSPNNSPTNVDMEEMRDHVNKVAENLLREDVRTGNEQMALILTNKLGAIVDTIIVPGDGYSTISTERINEAIAASNHSVNLNLNVLDIAAWVHTQNDPRPSAEDWGFLNNQIGKGLADPNAVTYIAQRTGDVYEYTTDKEGSNEVGEKVNGTC